MLVDAVLRALGNHPYYLSYIRGFQTERRAEDRLNTPSDQRLTIDTLERQFLLIDEDMAHTFRNTGRRHMAMNTSGIKPLHHTNNGRGHGRSNRNYITTEDEVEAGAIITVEVEAAEEIAEVEVTSQAEASTIIMNKGTTATMLKV